MTGLSFNIGASVQKGGMINLGINLARNGSVNLSKDGRWKAFGGASVGTTLAMIPIAGANAGLAYTFENKKMDQSLTNRSEKTVSAGVHAIWSPSIFGWGVNLGIDRDLNRGRIEQERKIASSISELTTQIVADGVVDGKFVADPAKIEEALKKRYGKTNKEDMTEAVQNLTSYFKMYNGVDINDTTKTMIANEISKAYALAWSNLQVQKLDEKGRYISGGGLSVTFFKGCVPVIGILKFANHRFTGTVDDTSSLMKVKEALKTDKYNENLEGSAFDHIDTLNKQLGKEEILTHMLVGDAHPTPSPDYVVLDLSKIKDIDIRIDPKMKGLIKKDYAGNLVFHKDTPMRALSAHLSDAKIARLDIGALATAEGAVQLNSSLGKMEEDQWFLGYDDQIDVNKLPTAKAKLTSENFNKAFQEVKTLIDQSDFKNSFAFSDLKLQQNQDGKWVVVDHTGEVKTELKPGHNLVITADNQFTWEKTPQGENFKIKVERFEQTQSEIKSEILTTDPVVTNTLDLFYNSISGIKSNALRNVGHRAAPKHIDDLYKEWRAKFKDTCCYKIGESIDKVAASADVMIKLMTGMASYVESFDRGKGSQFINVADYLKRLNASQDPADKLRLQQMLLGLDGMFSRTSNVRGTDQQGVYKIEFGQESTDQSFGQTLKHNQVNILATMKRKGVACYDQYSELFQQMAHDTTELGKNGEVKALPKQGVLAYNYGNPDDMMRPIINPHIIEGSEKSESERPIGQGVKLHVLQELFSSDSAFVVDLMQQLAKDTSYADGAENLRAVIYEKLPGLIAGNHLDI